MNERVRRRATVHGRVQGVYYRHLCRQQAERLGLAGWVRNRIDGTVELEVEGPPEAVETLLAWARVGPPRALVERLDIEALGVVGDTGFQVR